MGWRLIPLFLSCQHPTLKGMGQPELEDRRRIEPQTIQLEIGSCHQTYLCQAYTGIAPIFNSIGIVS
jgi:hypothetical protein